MKRALLIAVAIFAVAVPSASADSTIIKRIRTSKAELNAYVQTVTSFRRSPGGTKGCVGYDRNKAGKALTWRCTFSTPRSVPQRCWARYRIGKSRRQDDVGRVYTVWGYDVLAHHCDETITTTTPQPGWATGSRDDRRRPAGRVPMPHTARALVSLGAGASSSTR